MSSSERPRWCSRITYSATTSSAFVRVKRKEKGDLMISMTRATADDSMHAPGLLGSYTRPGEGRQLDGCLCRARPGWTGRRGQRRADRDLDRAAARRRVGG